jgi:hypothetical protein
MLAVSAYDQDYIDTCREKVGAQVAAYEALARAARNGAEAGSALDAFEPLFFNNMVLVLDALFVHRLRNKEGKDGNPVNEVRVLSESLVQGDGVLTVPKSIKLDPEHSVLHHAPGDEIALSCGDFQRLAEAYFAEMQARYTD